MSGAYFIGKVDDSVVKSSIKRQEGMDLVAQRNAVAAQVARISSGDYYFNPGAWNAKINTVIDLDNQIHSLASDLDTTGNQYTEGVGALANDTTGVERFRATEQANAELQGQARAAAKVITVQDLAIWAGFSALFYFLNKKWRQK